MINQSFTTTPVSEVFVDKLGTSPTVVFIVLTVIMGIILFSGLLNPSKGSILGIVTAFVVLSMVTIVFVPDILNRIVDEEPAETFNNNVAKTPPPSLVEEPIITVSNYSSVNVTDINIDTDMLDLGDLLS